MNKPYYLFVILTVFNLSLLAQSKKDKLSIGEIEFNSATDDPKFQFCNPGFVLQAYEARDSHNENRKWISLQLNQEFVYHPNWKEHTGFITVRFAVNCLGLTDRFRVMSVNKNLKAIDFPKELNQYLIKLVKQIKWPVESYRLKTVDYYQDVTFKIVGGELKEVLL